MLRRAIARGELPNELDVELAADLVLGPLSTRFMFGPGVQERIVPRLVAMALAGMRGAPAVRGEAAPGASGAGR